MRVRLLRLSLVPTLLVTSGFVACSHGPEAPPPPCEAPEPLSVRLQAAERLNIGDRGESLPTTVRVLQLKDDIKLNESTFDEVVDRPADALGDKLLATEELSVAPNETVSRTYKRLPDTSAIAVIALFREPAGTFWRAVRRLPAADSNHCRKNPQPPFSVRLEENRLEVR